MKYLVNIFCYDLDKYYYFILKTGMELTDNEIINYVVTNHMPGDIHIDNRNFCPCTFYELNSRMMYKFKIRKIKDIQTINYNKKIINNCNSEFSEAT